MRISKREQEIFFLLLRKDILDTVNLAAIRGLTRFGLANLQEKQQLFISLTNDLNRPVVEPYECVALGFLSRLSESQQLELVQCNDPYITPVINWIRRTTPNPPISQEEKHRTAKGIIEYVRSRGSDTSNLRDAVHEACHALEAKIENWDRNSIHEAMQKIPTRIPSEITARAVEQIVCSDLGVSIATIETWCHIACTEATTLGFKFCSYTECVTKVKESVLDKESLAMANLIFSHCGVDS